MKQETKWILIILGVIIAWAILSGNLDIGNLFSVEASTQSASSSMSGASGGIGG